MDREAAMDAAVLPQFELSLDEVWAMVLANLPVCLGCKLVDAQLEQVTASDRIKVDTSAWVHVLDYHTGAQKN